MKPRNIVMFPERVRDILLANSLGHLIEKLEDQCYMKAALMEHMEKLGKKDSSIPSDVDWIYAQYNEAKDMHFTAILCPNCFQSKLLTDNNLDAICGRCQTEFTIVAKNTVRYKNK